MKLKVKHTYKPNFSTAPVIGSDVTLSLLTQEKETDYVGNNIYENDKLKRLLVDGGYWEDGKYYFFQQDHLGNTRVVQDQDGTLIQRKYYYPFGAGFAENTKDNGKQPYKYNGKELDQMHRLDWYDYSARHYDPALGRFTTVDPLAEDYYSISPYAYVMNNPLKYIDPDGKQGILPFPFPATLLGNSNPILPMGRNIGMLSTADKMVRITSKTSESKLNQTRLQSGRNVEAEQLQKLGLEKNTEFSTRIDPKTGKEGTTIPDAIKDGQTVEIKNVKQQGLSRQLRLQEKLSNENGKKPILHINKDAKLTKPLQNSFERSTYGNSSVISSGNIKVSTPTLGNPIQEQQNIQRHQESIKREEWIYLTL
ncbi:RHS repeat-associated protein [Dysgonomonas sp. PFB1-18]|uniref:RHS repeat-associated core domain-containing protein n=1 Tax=unclassified Dysgonomonas TaxID=2630389 RepID=UPI00247447BD|nr:MULTISPECIES: RHS repeat-associated core domain-containing protein [unclassified Dysgonomonas]MDH6310684.1 RHS repeat-associated protein [Dysgonomonas sp. PF1-14]MDH6340535.1 RHS repeat-associated protein [Dysgonomonas sp. PF1-16]MDH6382209.1 RHS repeat-associated protein [Dysgonomonas sp. PFB1-18]MDH6399552.1 RHS repeat-associated protein [Dysgonomonas sp. PF1-23]